ncbi:hypothetical protein Prudu_015895, partial [Prunus dulcis]
YFLIGAAEVFTFIGQLEFFYDQAPDAMRSLCSALSLSTVALGNYFNSILVTIVTKTTTKNKNPGWIPNNLNYGHLDYFFWLLAVLSVLNLGAYLLISKWYTRRLEKRDRLSSPLSDRKMIRKRYQDVKAGYQLAKSLNAQKYLKKIGLGKEDYYFWKQIGKALLCTYTLFGVAWLYNEKSPLGWWTLKPKPKEERELAHLYERRQFPYPGDEEAMEEFVAKGE